VRRALPPPGFVTERGPQPRRRVTCSDRQGRSWILRSARVSSLVRQRSVSGPSAIRKIVRLIGSTPRRTPAFVGVVVVAEPIAKPVQRGDSRANPVDGLRVSGETKCIGSERDRRLVMTMFCRVGGRPFGALGVLL